MQHVQDLKGRPFDPLDLETPSLQWERLGPIARELPPLFKKHYDELATHKDAIQLEPDWDKYFALDFDGNLRILTVRDNGMLVGYLFLIAGPGLHYATTLQAQVDMFWLDPLYRAGWFPITIFTELLRYCRELKVTRLYASEKHHFERDRGGVGMIFKRLGFEVQDIVWAIQLR